MSLDVRVIAFLGIGFAAAAAAAGLGLVAVVEPATQVQQTDLSGPAGGKLTKKIKKRGKLPKPAQVVQSEKDNEDLTATFGGERQRLGVTFGSQQGVIGGDDFISPISYSDVGRDDDIIPEIQAPVDLPVLPTQQPTAENQFAESMTRLAGGLNRPGVESPTMILDDSLTHGDIVALMVALSELEEA